MSVNGLQKLSKMLKGATTIIVGAGAGMGKDSGLPDFRGNEGFWNNYPPYRNKFDFYDCANPNFLYNHPDLFWGFYGSRLNMYREKQPHQGFHIIKDIANEMAHRNQLPLKSNYFVTTSNVDGHFSKAKFDQELIYEVHGSINHLQCTKCQTITPNTFQPQVNFQTMSCVNLPRCSTCQQIQRPNVLMFNDWQWLGQRTKQQQKRYSRFINYLEKQDVVLVEIGCGTAVPTIRNMMEQLYYLLEKSKFININPDKAVRRTWLQSERYLDLQMTALQGLKAIKGAYLKS